MNSLSQIIAILVNLLKPAGDTIAQLFKALSQLNGDDLKVALGLLDAPVAQKIWDWAQALLANAMPEGSTLPPELVQPNYSDDYLEVLKGTKYYGPKLTPEQAQDLCNQMSKARKSEDVWSGIQIGMMIGAMHP
jgi:hypothetical protein